MNVSDSFRAFLKEAPQFSDPWMQAVEQLSGFSTPDDRTRQPAYLAVMAALGLTTGITFHAGLARKAGASGPDVITAILVDLPSAGITAVGTP